MKPDQWSAIARRVQKAVRDKVDGVVVTHGTDTLGYTAAALCFALEKVPVPVVLVGAQRSSDRPSSDATLNLIGGVSIAATAPFSGVYVAMHLDESDDRVAVHFGTRVRKNHTSRRDAFASVGVPLAAVWSKEGFEHVAGGLPGRGAPGFSPRLGFDEKVALLKFHPAMPPALIKALGDEGFRGVVVEGTGLGHTDKECARALRAYVKGGGCAFMTSQCISGTVDMDVYDTGRDLLKAGVVPLGDMLPETALVKAMWALGNSASAKDAVELMKADVAGEYASRRFPG
jgi:glutamyl-tRNA(Gln) amidotransferase subunit D